jgi:hypothetical protein
MVTKKKAPTKKVSRVLKWREDKSQVGGSVVRWFDSNKGGIISVVTGNSKGNERIGIDGEIRVSTVKNSFSIPCSLGIVKNMSGPELIRVVERTIKRRKLK